MFSGPANRRKFHRRRGNKSYWKVPFFFSPKALCNGIELHQDRYLRMHRILNLLPFGNLSHSVYLLADLFSGVEGLRILWVWLLETLYSITLYCVKLFLTHLFR